MFFVKDSELENLQANYEAPDWMQPRGYRTLVGSKEENNGYLLPGETPKGLYKRLASTAAKYLARPDLEDSFFEILYKGWLGPASPIASNFGTNRAMPISCFSSFVPDNIEGIIDHVAEISMLSAKGGGVASHLEDIRPIGAPINSGGKAEGYLMPLRMIAAAIESINQGGIRRGAGAAYLDIEHPDAKMFLRMRRPENDEKHRFDTMHHGVKVSNAFMERCKNKDPEALELWDLLLTTRIETGEPYIFFTDAAQRDNPPSYKRLGLEVKSSNLCCLEGSTKILTRDSHKTILEVLNKPVEIWDGQAWTEVVFEYKGKTHNLVKVDFADGTFIRTTVDHRFPLINGKFVLAKDLVIGDYVEVCNWGDPDFLKQVSGQITNVVIIEVKAEPVYCCTVSTTGKFALADGRMTGNSEIFLATNELYSFVCCLSSLNLAKYDEWKDTNTVELAIYFLDAVMSEFIQKSAGNKHLKKTRDFAINSRALGLGVLGYHTYLQQNMISFESEEARQFNKTVFASIKAQANAASIKLGQEYGVPDWCTELGRRNTHLISLAPTRSNSAICNSVSPSIEPITANIGFDDGAKGNLVSINNTLIKVLERYGFASDLVLASISANNGSVQHLRFLSEQERLVFRTAREIDQAEVVQQAIDRGIYIDQGQSLNLFYNPDINPKVVHKHHIQAWKGGLKSLYYVRSNSLDKIGAVSNLSARVDSVLASAIECPVCEG